MSKAVWTIGAPPSDIQHGQSAQRKPSELKGNCRPAWIGYKPPVVRACPWESNVCGRQTGAGGVVGGDVGEGVGAGEEVAGDLVGGGVVGGVDTGDLVEGGGVGGGDAGDLV